MHSVKHPDGVCDYTGCNPPSQIGNIVLSYIRSALEVHPISFLRLLTKGAPYLTRKLTSAKVNTKGHFSKQDGHSDDIGLRSPPDSNIIPEEMCYLVS